ncbi:MAG: hypothetical protein DMG13_28665 [Acidobacteria bacterium]|nr:MAG: hypothetical protein DMG13_28665 [Acidobacteriota bacterium]
MVTRILFSLRMYCSGGTVKARMTSPNRCGFGPAPRTRYNDAMRAKAIIFLLVVVSIAGYWVYHAIRQPRSRDAIEVGQQAPQFSVKDGTGREVKLTDYRGKLVFLNFWATACEECIDEMAELELINRAFKDRKFQMLAISVDTDWDAVRKFYADYNLSLPAFLDLEHRISRLYKVENYPETFLIDANGLLIQHLVGPERWADPHILGHLDSMIRQQEMGRS